MKPSDFNFKNKPTNRLLLLLCLVGAVVVVWWAWSAGPIRTKSAIQTSQNSQAQSKLSTPSYDPLKSAAPGGSTSPTYVSSSSSSASSVAPPVSVQPSYPFCYPRSGIQPDIAYPCNCGGRGIELACPESTY